MSRSMANRALRLAFLAAFLAVAAPVAALEPPRAPGKPPATVAAVAFPVTLTLKPAAGVTYEKIMRARYKTVIVKPRTVLSKVIDTGMREGGRVMDTRRGEVTIASRATRSVLKVNGRKKKGGVPGASERKVRVYNHRGGLVRSSMPGVVPGDLRELAVKVPRGPLPAGKRWRQTFRLAGEEGAPSLPIQAEFEIGGRRTVAGRPGREIRGALKLVRQQSPNKLLTCAGAGKALVVLDEKTGMPLFKSLRLHVEEVREDVISQEYVKAGGKKLGFYIDLAMQEKAEYLGRKRPPSLTKAKKKPAAGSARGSKPAASKTPGRGAKAPAAGGHSPPTTAAAPATRK